MLKIRNLDSGYGKLRVLKNISLHVDGGEIVAMMVPTVQARRPCCTR
jgi:branched-chain amino acid transport system ATP-binding protein